MDQGKLWALKSVQFNFQDLKWQCDWTNKGHFIVKLLTTFHLSKYILHKKALKAYYKLHNDLLTLNPNINTNLHVFNHTIKSILLYGCEIWGSFNPTTARFRNETITLDKIYQNLKCELLHTKFCKFILGVHKKSTNFGVLSELRRFPIYYDIFKSMLNYWHRLETLDSTFPILQDAYITSKTLFESKTTSWYGSINTYNFRTNTRNKKFGPIVYKVK
jgi:hypothetical protein